MCDSASVVNIFFVLLAGLLACVGCRRSASFDAVNSDANGYLCAECGARFYTSENVFADHCPSCPSTDLLPLVGYVCPRDRHVTITIKSNAGMLCEQCGATVTSVKLPRARELEAWNAVRRNRAEVCGKVR